MDENVFNPQSKVKRRGLYYGPMTLVLIFLVIMIVLSLFFRVSEIEVVNASDYSDEQIIIASGIEKGANLFFVDRFAAASMIFSDLPYMDTISIQRQLPGKIIIQAEGSAPAAYMVVDGDYWFIDRTGKMLGVTSVLQAEKFPEIRNCRRGYGGGRHQRPAPELHHGADLCAAGRGADRPYPLDRREGCGQSQPLLRRPADGLLRSDGKHPL